MRQFRVKTSDKNQVVDLTEQIQAELPQAGAGAVSILAAHTTCGITTADLDPGTDLDFLNALRHLLPELRYRHPHDPEHAPDHILASLIGPSLLIPFNRGQLVLGTWQRIVLVELDGPRERAGVRNNEFERPERGKGVGGDNASLSRIVIYCDRSRSHCKPSTQTESPLDSGTGTGFG